MSKSVAPRSRKSSAPATPELPAALAKFPLGGYPELKKKPYADRIALWTLSSLGFKRSDEAVAAGYLCVIPHVSTGMRAFPAQWVAPADFELLAQLIEEIHAARHQAEVRAASLQEAAQARKAAQQTAAHEKAQRKVAQLLKKAPVWMDRERLAAWASQQQNATNPKAIVLPLGSYFTQHASELKRLGLKRQPTRARIPVQLPLTLKNNVMGGVIEVSLKTEVSLADLEERIWRTPALGFMEAVSALVAEAAEKERQAVQGLLDEHVTLTSYTREIFERYQLSADAWGRLMQDLLRGGATLDPFIKARESALKQVERRVLLARCKAAFPSQLDAFYPVARGMSRRLKLIVGPTNSGKTHQAIERLKAAKTGCYLGPLRLLALEIRDRLEAEGTPASLVTGELIEAREGAQHAACTVEMLDFEKEQEVIVIDEVQMLGDPQRGAAWVQAILGAPAKEVWMLGAPEAEAAVLALARFMGEEIEVLRTERLTPLKHHDKAAALQHLPPHSAVIAFSRQDVLDIAAELKDKHNRDCAVIYGALSPEVRRQQTARFRDGEVDVVVATDAIAMGLNLSLRHVFFSVSEKWDGTQNIPIPRDLVWQIAGRAGRFGHHEEGFVGALDKSTLGFVRKSLGKRPAAVPELFRFSATWPVVKRIAQYFETERLADILAIFAQELVLGADRRFLSTLEDTQRDLAKLVDRFDLDLQDKHTLSMAPVPLEKKQVPAIFHEFAKAVARKEVFGIERLGHYQADRASQQLERAEQAVKMLSLYSWLHYRYPEIFMDFQAAQEHIDALNQAIGQMLKGRESRRCTSCGKRLYRSEPFPRCDKCHRRESRRSAGWDAGYHYF